MYGRNPLPGKALLIRLSALGDVVQTTAVVEALHRAGWTLHYLTDTALAPLLEPDPRIHRVWHFPRREGLRAAREVLTTLKRESFDLIADLHAKPLTRWLASRIPARHRVRIARASLRRRWWVYRRRLPRYEIPMSLRMHASLQRVLRLPFAPPRLLPLYPSPLPDPGVVIVPFTARPLRDWPALYAYRLAQMLERQGIPATLAGQGPSLPWPTPHRNLLNRTDLLQYVGLIQQARVVVTMDTSASHIAAALGIPTVVLWGPTHPRLGMRPVARAPLFALGLPLPCRPCSVHGSGRCRLHHHACLRDLTPERVVGLIRILYTIP